MTHVRASCRRSGEVLTLVVQVVGTTGIQEHAIGIVHEMLRGREVYLGPQRAAIVAGDGCAGRYSRLDIGSCGGLSSHSGGEGSSSHEERGQQHLAGWYPSQRWKGSIG